jgi:carboxymethylenebutenolidase
MKDSDKSPNASIETDRIALETGDGPMHAHVARPAGGGVHPGILVFLEAFGVNAHIREVANRLAQLGFAAIAPELFHRTGDGFEAAYGDREAIAPHMEALSNACIAEDAKAAHGWLERHADPLRTAAIGFCMGGRAAWIANAHLPLKAAISFYGGGIAPALLGDAGKQHAPLLMFWGGADAHIPAEQYRAVADALDTAGVEHEQVVFSKAGHGFFCDARESFHVGAAAQAWELVRAFLRYTM